MLDRNLGKTLAWVFILLLSCAFCDAIQASPSASFTANQTTGCAPLNVQFTSTSSNAVSYYWDLGNGNSSTLANPSNLYTTPGNYTVKLVAYDASGNADTALYVNFITVVPKPSASFHSNITTSCPDNNVFSFTNTSTGAATYLWDFGDGTTSTLVNPTHSFTYAGVVTVTLVATGTYGCQDIKIINQYITVHPKPDATIIATDSTTCDPASSFQFSNSAQNGMNWQWSFGDQQTSSLQNPSHIYSGQGTYYVSLIVTNTFGCKDTSDNPVLIRVGFNNFADFTIDVDSGCTPLTVQFTNTNSNVATSLWDFGDGSVGMLNSTPHTYTTGGNFSVSLIVTTLSGCVDTVVKNNLIHTGTRPTAGFQFSPSSGCAPHAVQFTNTSTNFNSCIWYFGDGTSSTAVNPTHVYTNSGIYSVTLQCQGSTGCSASKLQQNIITVTKPDGVFTGSPRVGCPPLQTSFTSWSPNSGVSYFWIFGDGSTSTQQNPVHTYSSSGSFDVSLIITDAGGCKDTIRKVGYIQTINAAANYIPPPTTSGCAPLTAQFTDATSGSIAWLWNFGDGTTSTLQNPTHTYTTPGFFTVSLNTVSAGGGCTQSISNFSSFQVNGGYAGFDFTQTTCPPYVVNFNDTSLNAISWLWEFDDGTTSTLQNPAHNFAAPGYHSASLTITTTGGCTYSTMQSNGIYFPPFGANFYGIPLDTIFPARVQFHANSVGATAWSWDFGDGSTSTLEDPLHIYQSFSPYNVVLTISNGTCTATYSPPPYFFGPPDSLPIDTGRGDMLLVQKGCAPMNVLFTKKVMGAVSWLWDFGDGDTSHIEFPTHIYALQGIYNVSLTTVDTLGFVQTLQFDSLVRVSGPIPGFIITQTASCTNTQVNVSDTSKYANSWFWDLGDGTTDTLQNPVHVYSNSQPNYIITQTVTDTAGCSASISSNLFSGMSSPLVASENEVCGMDTVYFYTSLQNYASYLWDFGDGQTSTQINPAHLYLTEGTFNVSLTVFDNLGCNHTYYINPAIRVNMPEAAFTTTGPRQGCDFLNVFFVNNSINADSYLWNFGDGNTTSQISPSHNYLQAGSYNVSLTVYRGSCTSVVNYPQYIRVDTAHAAFTFVSDKVCLPITTNFTDHSINPVSWRWSFGDGDTSNIQNPTHQYVNSPCCFPFIIITDNHGCVDTATAPGFPVFKAVFTTSADSGCYPTTIQFTNRSSPMADSWYWDFGDGTTSTLANPSHTYTQPGVYDVMLVITSVNVNCPDTMIMPAKIKIRAPHADFISSDLPACAPSLVNFTSLSSDADGYLWNFGDGSTSTNQNPAHIYNTPGIFDVTLTAINSLGCSDSVTKHHYIKVLGPITNFTATNLQGCSPLHVTFIDQSTNAVSYSWNFGDGYSDTSKDPVHTFLDSGSFTVSLVTQDTSGCTSFKEMPQPVVVLPAPNTSFTIDSPGGCVPFTAAFTNTTTGFSTLQWNFADGTTSTQQNPSHQFTVAGDYDVQLIAFNSLGCSDTARLSQPVDVVPFPTPAFTTFDTIGCAPFHVTFIDQSTNLEGPQYLWDFGNGQTSTDPNPSIFFTIPGAYDITLTLTNTYGCSSHVTYFSMVQAVDNTPPNETKIMSVSVEDNTSVKIIWENNPAIDLAAYIIYRHDPQVNIYRQIYTETDVQNTNFALTSEYIDTALNTLQNTYTYKVQAIDLCGNTIPLDLLTAHTTINVSSQQAGEEIQVDWTPYSGCPVSSYQLFRAEPGMPFTYITSLPPDTYTYLDTTCSCPIPFSYKIMATDLCGNVYTSYSDTSVTIPVNKYEGQLVDIVRSTVFENTTVLTEWVAPAVHPEKVMQYEIYRSTDNSNYSYLTSVPSIQTDYMDYDVDVQTSKYYYRVLVVNDCNIDAGLSGNTSTILLTGEMNEGRQVHLTWSPYNGWENGVEYYILEKLDDTGHWQILRQVDGNIYEYDHQE